MFDISGTKSNAESSVAGLASTLISVSPNSLEIAVATALAATAAVPCPITTTFVIFPYSRSRFN